VPGITRPGGECTHAQLDHTVDVAGALCVARDDQPRPLQRDTVLAVASNTPRLPNRGAISTG